MPDIKPSEDRLEMLEMRLAHQEAVIDDLNAAVTAQWTQIDGLKRKLAQLAAQLEEAETKAGSLPGSQKPPHY